jgi:predicted acylesterase/phospholipase RssA
MYRSAAVASCAIPGIYQPVQLMAKNKHGEIVPYYVENVLFMDGSVALDLPLERLRELFNVNHFIVSQVNPHVVPFLFRAQSYRVSSALHIHSFIAQCVFSLIFSFALLLTIIGCVSFTTLNPIPGL